MFLPRHNLKFFRKTDVFYNISNKLSENKEPKWKKRIFSGIQPSGALHLGNYFGAVEKWISLQNEGYDVVYSIADLHSITLPQDPNVLSSNIHLMAASLIACGIDPSKSILFQQSRVHQHTGLCWVLCCHSTMARLAHLPQYKEKRATIKDVPLGLFAYPVLQAADILLYKATDVPVGEDQEQHLQVAQTISRMFNNRYGSTFPIPNGLIQGSGRSKVKSLREPDKKMSKSHADCKSRIELTDSPDKIKEKLRKAVTDCTSAVTYQPETRMAVANLITLHALASNKTPQQISCENTHLDTGRYKSVVADALIERFNPIRLEIERLLSAPDYLNQVLDRGAEQASAIAENTWQQVKQKVGFDLKEFSSRSDQIVVNSCTKIKY